MLIPAGVPGQSEVSPPGSEPQESTPGALEAWILEKSEKNASPSGIGLSRPFPDVKRQLSQQAAIDRWQMAAALAVTDGTRQLNCRGGSVHRR